MQNITKRLAYLRNEIINERISYGEIAELQSLAEYIPKDDVLLLEWVNVPEAKHYCNYYCDVCAEAEGLVENGEARPIISITQCDTLCGRTVMYEVQRTVPEGCTCKKIIPEMGNRLPNKCPVHHVDCDCVGHAVA